MPVNVIASGNSTVTSTAANQTWFLPVGRTLVAPNGDAFRFGDFSDVTLIVAGSISNTSGDGIGDTGSPTGLSVIIEGSGSVSGGSDGVEFLVDNSSIQNAGSIVGGSEPGIDALGDNMSIVNGGTISSASTRAIDLDGDFIHLSNTGSISASFSGGPAVRVAGENAFIFNGGTISADGDAVEFTAAGRSVLVNTGTLTTAGSRAVFGGDGGHTIVNEGEIEGNVSLGGGDDYFDSREGKVFGKVFGGDGNDTIFDDARGGLVSGGGGADRISGALGNDLIKGNSGNDDLRGNKGKDDVRGGDGNDFLQGGRDKDVLRGGAGEDVLNGGRENDTLIGNQNADIFRFEINAGRDTIKDFQNSVDRIDLSDFGFVSFAAVAAEISNNASNNNAVIDLDALGGSGRVIVKDGFGLLDAGDFIL